MCNLYMITESTGSSTPFIKRTKSQTFGSSVWGALSYSNDNTFLGGAVHWNMMGCFIGFFGLLNRNNREVKSSFDLKQREIYAKKAVAHGCEAATRHRRAKALEQGGGGAKTSEARALGFDLDDLLRASAEVLGKGALASSYKANLDSLGKSMVVKRLRDFNTPDKQFEEMLDAIDEMNHENLHPLTAYYTSKDEKLLVYEFLPMGSLHSLLHVNGSGGYKSPLSWDKRTKIALGVARAIAHIHSRSPTAFHGNIKSSKIFLTSTFEARVSDYGLAQYAPHFAGFGSTADRSYGYRAPELTNTNKMSQKADVYSFGVLFLELLTRKDPTELYFVDEGMDLPRWMQSAVNDEWTSEVFDVEILRYEDVQLLLRCLELAFIWTAGDPDMRPSMVQVITQIEKLCCSGEQRYTDMKHPDRFYREYLTDSGALPYSFYS